MNILLDLSYDGTRYCGFQVQKNGLSICEALQDAMQAVFKSRPDIKGCSRTDAGVHAEHYALSFFVDTHIPMEKLPLALNQKLPEDIRVNSACVVPDEFHARYSVHAKTYHYRIWNSPIDSPFQQKYYYRVPAKLDVSAMQRAAAAFVGRQDFASLCAADCETARRSGTVRTITDCHVKAEGQMVTVSVTADGYLYNMVRILAGTLLQVGQGKKSPEDVPQLLAARDRAQAGPTLPARGLFLHRIEYDENKL